MKYFEFQYTWGDIMARMESDGGLRQALVQAAIARQSGGRIGRWRGQRFRLAGTCCPTLIRA